MAAPLAAAAFAAAPAVDQLSWGCSWFLATVVPIAKTLLTEDCPDRLNSPDADFLLAPTTADLAPAALLFPAVEALPAAPVSNR